MNEKAPEPYIPTEDDIVFDCPACARELAIDYRGAGLTVPCPHCKARVEVPVPDDVEIVEDAAETQSISPPETKEEAIDDKDRRIADLAEQLGLAQSRSDELVQELVETRQRRKRLENERHENIKRFDLVAEELSTMQNALDRIVNLIGEARGNN